MNLDVGINGVNKNLIIINQESRNSKKKKKKPDRSNHVKFLALFGVCYKSHSTNRREINSNNVTHST